jgi:hypothetical protein
MNPELIAGGIVQRNCFALLVRRERGERSSNICDSRWLMSIEPGGNPSSGERPLSLQKTG